MIISQQELGKIFLNEILHDPEYTFDKYRSGEFNEDDLGSLIDELDDINVAAAYIETLIANK